MKVTWCHRASLFAVALLGFAGPASAACPGSLTNGTTADATQVMAWMNCKASLDGAMFTGTIGIGTTNPQGVLDLGNGTGGTGIAWGGTDGTTRYTNIFSSYGAAGLVLAGGFKGGTSSDIYQSTYGSSIARAGIRLNPFGSDAGSIQFFTDPASSTAVGTQVYPTERMRITSSGYVGIGTASPSAQLTLEGLSQYIFVNSTTGADAGIMFQNNAGPTWRSGIGIWTAGANNAGLALFTNGNGVNNPRVYVGPSNVGIGTTSPGQSLDVAGSIRQSGCTTAGTLSVNASGDIICSSDARLKNVRGAYTGGLNKILGLRPVRFTYRPTHNNPVEVFEHAGFIAQDVSSAIPQAVARQRDGHYSLDTTAILAASVNAIQELHALNKRLESRIQSQDAEIAELGRKLSAIRASRVAKLQ